MRKLISIIIATYNSKHLLEKVFCALAEQTYPKDLIEVIAVDGGSSDDTKAYVLSKGYTVIDNPKTEPVYAKYLGYRHAAGDYILYLDHDEVLENPKSIENKVKIFECDNNIKAVIGSGYKTPEGISFINNYINEFGDPFSAFRYNLSKMDGFFICSMRKRYDIIRENNFSVCFSFESKKNLPIIELAAAGSMVDGHYFKTKFPQTLEVPDLIAHTFYMMIDDEKALGIAKNDAIFHYSSDTFAKYLNKIKWRIKNNIFFPHMAKAGFIGRNKYEQGFVRYKKYFFLPYAFSVILPLLRSVHLVFTRKKPSYFVHLPLVLYTAAYISFYLTLKMAGFKPNLKSYDEGTIITSSRENS